jgi:hypothetical protein
MCALKSMQSARLRLKFASLRTNLQPVRVDINAELKLASKITLSATSAE